MNKKTKGYKAFINYEKEEKWLKELPNHPESEDYIEFLSDSGVEHVTSYAR